MRATAYWTISPGQGALREEEVAAPGPGEALVQATYSGISRGTELLVHRGAVPDRVAQRMRAPFQAGDLPGPVKYGYLSVGTVQAGEAKWLGRRVFCLHPHQDRYVVPVDSLTPIPDDVPDQRAVLAGTMETAVNALWDALPAYGDRIAVIGGGMVGAGVLALLARLPLQRLQLVDPDPERAALAAAWGAEGVDPADAAGDCDLVFHCSATSAGLQRSLELLGEEGEVIELSWYGDQSVSLDLGADFHPKRLAVRASQVGRISPHRQVRRTHADRMALAMQALTDPALDRLLAGPTPFAELPALMDRLAQGASGLCHVVRYQHGDPQPVTPDP